MRRRAFVGLLGAGIAGCASQDKPTREAGEGDNVDDDDNVEPSENDSTEGSTDKRERTKRTAENLGVPEDLVVPPGEWWQYEEVRIKLRWLSNSHSVVYNNPEEASIEEWEVEEGRTLVFAKFTADNLSNDGKDFPRAEDFYLVTPDDFYEPITELPDGTSVSQIYSEESEHVPYIGTNYDGVTANGHSTFSFVFHLENQDSWDKIAIQWVEPSEPIYFG